MRLGQCFPERAGRLRRRAAAQTCSEIKTWGRHTVMPRSTMQVPGEPVGDGDGEGDAVGEGVGDGDGPGCVLVGVGDG
jgi:hypothetical protein